MFRPVLVWKGWVIIAYYCSHYCQFYVQKKRVLIYKCSNVPSGIAPWRNLYKIEFGNPDNCADRLLAQKW